MSHDEIKQTIENLKIIQNMLSEEYRIANDIDDDYVYEDCEQVEEIQNTIYILEELL